jgi:dolichol-phosphate mannosyltransferase
VILSPARQGDGVARPAGVLDRSAAHARLLAVPGEIPSGRVRLSVILPTYNEAQNLPILVPRLAELLRDVRHEIIVVDDDSPDGTWRVAEELGDRFDEVRVVRRIGRRGLASAVIEGFLAAKGAVLVAADADGQHDLRLVTDLLAAVDGGAGLALASRYVPGGSVGAWDERRHALSRFATRLAQRLCRVPVADPMSGFFAVSRPTFRAALPQLNPVGFKILLDLLVHLPPGTTVREIPLRFGSRVHGESKLSRLVQLEFLEYVYDVTLGRRIPLTLVKYCVVGGLGVIVNAAAFLVASALLGPVAQTTLRGFSIAVLVATETAIVFNFALNNAWTFSLARLSGRRLFAGFLRYNAACALGALANFAVSGFLFSRGWLGIVAALAGALVGAIWNYAMSRLVTWKQ